MHAATRDRRQHARQSGALESIEDVTYRVLRHYQPAIKTVLKDFGSSVTLIESIPSSLTIEVHIESF